MKVGRMNDYTETQRLIEKCLEEYICFKLGKSEVTTKRFKVTLDDLRKLHLKVRNLEATGFNDFIAEINYRSGDFDAGSVHICTIWPFPEGWSFYNTILANLFIMDGNADRVIEAVEHLVKIWNSEPVEFDEDKIINKFCELLEADSEYSQLYELLRKSYKVIRFW